jgi:hypothetical protein
MFGTMMSSLPQIPSVQPAEPMQLDAFRSTLNAAGAALGASPDAIGQTLLSGIDGFNTRETQFRTAVEHAAAPEAPQGTTPGAGEPPSAESSTTPHPMTAAQAIQEGETLQRQSMGMMMQTYSFALEASLVSNAATTFTSSVNTLIKTQ